MNEPVKDDVPEEFEEPEEPAKKEEEPKQDEPAPAKAEEPAAQEEEVAAAKEDVPDKVTPAILMAHVLSCCILFWAPFLNVGKDVKEYV